MKTQYGFTLMTIGEFETWLIQQKVTRRITVIQEHHTWSPSYKQFNGSSCRRICETTMSTTQAMQILHKTLLCFPMV